MKQFVASMGQYRKENSDILAEGKAKIEMISSDILILSRSINNGNQIYLAVNRTEHYQNISYRIIVNS